MAKTNQNGRSATERHIRIYRYLWPAMLERLNGNAFKALFYLLTFEDGSNNGQLFMGARDLAKGIGVDPKTALLCLHHLDRQGFIRPEQLGYFQQKGGPATRWRLTFLPANGKPPTNEWKLPPAEQKSWRENFPDAVGENTTKPSAGRAAVGKIGTAEADSNEAPVGITGTHTIASIETNPVGLIRSQISDWWRTSDAKGRLRLAKQHGLLVGDILDFLQGGDLAFPKMVALGATLKTEKSAA